MREFVSVLLTVVLVVGPWREAYAWGPVAHYEITRAAGFPDLLPYTNVPDYRSSRELNVISPYFSWSHGVQDEGQVIIAPEVFSYPNDGRYPGFGMVILVRKIKNAAQEMTLTAEGSVAHNAGDRPVHCDFFLGGSTYRWYYHHGQKELWADYLIYFETYNIAPGQAFNSDGSFKPQPGALQEVPYAGSARLMRLSQRAYNKNRRRPSAVSDEYGITVESEAQIQQFLDSMPYESSSRMSNWTSDTWDDLYETYMDYLALQYDGDPSNDWKVWSRQELWANFQESVNNVQSWVTTARAQ